MSDTAFTATTSDEFEIYGVRRIIADSEATVILCHGIGGSLSESGLFDDFADAAQDARLSTIRFDFRSHGSSSGAPTDLSLSGEFEDLTTVARLVAPEGSPIVPIGTSFGCYAAAHFAQARSREDVPALVLWNPVVRYQRTFLEANNEWSSAIVASGSDSLPPGVVARLPGSTAVISARLAREFETEDTAETIRKLRVPILLFHGTEDGKVPYEFSRELAADAPNVTLVPVDGAEHGFRGYRPEIVERTIRWINETIS
jgi:pimeloyl-ACP methyl ester carboxylesterase